MSLDSSEEEFSDPIASGQCFNEAITHEQDFLRALARMIGVPDSDVGDVLQETNLYLVQNQSDFVPGTNFRAWAAKVLRYRCMSYFRSVKRSKTVNLSGETLEIIIMESMMKFDVIQTRMERLRTCMNQLNAQQLQLLLSVYIEGKNLKQLAKASDQSHTALRKSISRIRLMLKKCIQNKKD